MRRILVCQRGRRRTTAERRKTPALGCADVRRDRTLTHGDAGNCQIVLL